MAPLGLDADPGDMAICHHADVNEFPKMAGKRKTELTKRLHGQ